MQHEKDLVEHPGGRGFGFGLRLLVVASQNRFDQFEIPVAENVPYEIIKGGCTLVVTMLLNRFGHYVACAREFAGDPTVDRQAHCNRIEIRNTQTPVYL